MSAIEPNALEFYQALGLYEEPFGMFYTETRPGQGLTPEPQTLPTHADEAAGRADLKSVFDNFSCALGYIKRARSKRTAAYFDREHYGCLGGAFFLGYNKPQLEAIVHYVSTGIPGHMEGECYLDSPEACRRVFEHIDPRPAPGRYCVFKPVSLFGPEEVPEIVTFFARPESVGALNQLAAFVTGDPEAAVSPFGSACANMVSWPLKFKERGQLKAVLGGWDPSARMFFKVDEITFSVPSEMYALFLERWRDSFLTAHAWQAARKKALRSNAKWGETGLDA